MPVAVRRPKPKPVEVYQIKVTLRDSEPAIWRRIRLDSGMTLARLHDILQTAFGWENAHLHEFVIRGERYGVPDEEDRQSQETRDERKYKLMDLGLSENSELLYVYDLGDNWEHDLVVEKVLSPEEHVPHPVCLAGERATPPEDVGGIGGYEEFLEVLQNPSHPQHEDMKEWIGGTFDPGGFDLEAVNGKLRFLR